MKQAFSRAVGLLQQSQGQSLAGQGWNQSDLHMTLTYYADLSRGGLMGLNFVAQLYQDRCS